RPDLEHGRGGQADLARLGRVTGRVAACRQPRPVGDLQRLAADAGGGNLSPLAMAGGAAAQPLPAPSCRLKGRTCEKSSSEPPRWVPTKRPTAVKPLSPGCLRCWKRPRGRAARWWSIPSWL